MKKNILVTGANGQLGNEFRQLLALYPQYNFLLATKDDLSIDNNTAVANFFAQHNISYCINCAAYTAVDKAETETEAAFLINATAVGNLAKASYQYKALFIHISTDYVFDGNATEPYKEDDSVSPVNLYGASKLKGEQLAIENNPNSIIIRTSWVYAAHGNNFVKTMLRLMTDRQSINVVNDQQGCPTYAADLAQAIMQIIEKYEIDGTIKPVKNIYHYSNAGAINWYQFAMAIKEVAGKSCSVNPIPASQYPTPAKRPYYSVMDTGAIQIDYGITIPFWKDSLKKCIHILQSK